MLTNAQRAQLLTEIASHRDSYVRRMAKAAIAESQGRDAGFFIDRADRDFITAIWKLDILHRNHSQQ